MSRISDYNDYIDLQQQAANIHALCKLGMLPATDLLEIGQTITNHPIHNSPMATMRLATVNGKPTSEWRTYNEQ